MSRELLKQVLDFCEFCWRDVNMNDYAFERLESTIDAIRAELAKPEQEPVGYVYTHNGMAQGALTNKAMIAGTPLYAAPVDCRCSRQMGHLGTASGEYVEQNCNRQMREAALMVDRLKEKTP